MFRTSRLAVPCQYSASGHQASSSKHTRSQSRETVPLIHFLAAWKFLPNVFQRVLHTVERGYKIQFGSRPPLFNGVFPTLVGPEQDLVMKQEVDTLLRKEAIEVVPSSRQRVRVLLPLLHHFEEGRGVASNSRYEIIEPLSHETQVQDTYFQASHVSYQIRGLVCDDRSERRLLPYIHSSSTPEVPKVCFQGQSIPISSSSVWPSTLTLHFHEVCGYSSGSLANPGHLHTELHGRLIDSSSIRAVSSLASRCHSRSHERIGVKAKRKEKCTSTVQFLQYRGPLIWAWCGIRPRYRHVCLLLVLSRSS